MISFGVTVGMYTASIVFSVVVWIPVLLFSRPVSAAAVHPVD